VAQKSEPFHYVAYNSSNTHTENRVVRTYLLDLSFSYVTLVATGVAGFLWLECPGFRASERRKSHSGEGVHDVKLHHPSSSVAMSNQ